MKDWLSEQMHLITNAWSNAIKNYYPQHYPNWSNPQKHLNALNEEWNYLDAVKYLNFNKITENSSRLRVLDLGAGTGWLSAYLSRIESINSIDALDSDKNNLNEMLPHIVRLLKGTISKINPILGLFSPLLVDDGYYDLIVASSSIHHSDNLFSLLKELRRALKKGGRLYILNETPYPYKQYLIEIFNRSIKIIYKAFRKKVNEFEDKISGNGILCDPYLGDYRFSYYQWDRAITQAGFRYKIQITPYFPYKSNEKQKIKLTHFICY